MARFLDDARRELDAAVPGVRFVTFGHLGDGNLHYNLAAPEGIEPESFLGNTDLVNRIVYDLVAATAEA
jgi:FAD/FMN-containing dehydrogenase